MQRVVFKTSFLFDSYAFPIICKSRLQFQLLKSQNWDIHVDIRYIDGFKAHISCSILSLTLFESNKLHSKLTYWHLRDIITQADYDDYESQAGFLSVSLLSALFPKQCRPVPPVYLQWTSNPESSFKHSLDQLAVC